MAWIANLFSDLKKSVKDSLVNPPKIGEVIDQKINNPNESYPGKRVSPSGSLFGAIPKPIDVENLPTLAQEAARRQPANQPTAPAPTATPRPSPPAPGATTTPGTTPIIGNWSTTNPDYAPSPETKTYGNRLIDWTNQEQAGASRFFSGNAGSMPVAGDVITQKTDANLTGRVEGNPGIATMTKGTVTNDAALFPGARTGQVFSGAATDAEAARSLLDRQRQSEAADFNIAQMNRAAEAQRDVLAAQLGVSRGVLDQMEGRSAPESAGVSLNNSAAPAPVDVFARPGDSFGDSQMREQQYQGLLDQAAQQRGIGAKRRAAAMIDAATGLLAPGAATAKLGAEQQQSANSLAAQLGQANAQLAGARYGADTALAGHKYTSDASLAGSRLKALQDQQEANRKAEQEDQRLVIEAAKANAGATKPLSALETEQLRSAQAWLASQPNPNNSAAIRIYNALLGGAKLSDLEQAQAQQGRTP